MNKHETIEDILAEMREHNNETTPPYVCFTEEGGIDLSQIIDRIEAALNRVKKEGSSQERRYEMSDETIAGIVSEMRSYNDRPPPRCAWLALADRIEAVSQFREATKEEVGVSKMETTTPTCKESLQVGNASKMRVALHLIHDQLKSYLERTILIESMILRIKNEINAAISAPPRNCDLYSTAKDALKAFEKETGSTVAIEFIRWLFAEAKGEAK